MPYTTINKSTDHFNTVPYTGNSSTNAITTGHSSGWVWIKRRDGTYEHNLFDQVRGVTKEINTNTTATESTVSGSVTSFDSNGFTLGNDGQSNTNNDTFVAWSWKAGGTGSSNGDGSITSTVSANTTSGFSIVKWTGSGANATIGHGLGAAPSFIITKSLASTQEWCVGSSSLGWDKYFFLNETSASASGSVYWQSTAPTSTVFSVGTAGPTNSSSGDLIAYCFVEKLGFSKFGKYTGNNQSDGTFVYTGFKPAWILIKRDNAGYSWGINDSKRPGFNETNKYLIPDTTAAEQSNAIDLLSNGFKLRSNAGGFNASATYYFWAFAESPLVGSNGVPVTAR
jgi:hypothetical protein